MSAPIRLRPCHRLRRRSTWPGGLIGLRGLGGTATDHEGLDILLSQLACRVAKLRIRNSDASSLDDQITALAQAIATQFVEHRGHHWRSTRIVVQNTDVIGPAALRPRLERPRHCRAAEQCDELAPLHSITSSARASNVAGMSRPSALAVLRLMTSSNLVGC